MNTAKTELLNVQSLIKEQTKLHFDIKVKKILFYDKKNFFTILNVDVITNYDHVQIPSNLTVQGHFSSPYVSDIYDVEGKFQEDDYYGSFLNVGDTATIKIPAVKTELILFIKRHVDGVGKVMATRIVDNLGLDAITKIIEIPDILVDKVGLNKKRADSIVETLKQHSVFEELIEFLQNLSIDTIYASGIYNLYADNSISLLKSNPYILCNVDFGNFVVADSVNKKLELDSHSINRLEAGILYYLYLSDTNGGNLASYADLLYKHFENGLFLSRYSAYNVDSSFDKSTIEMALTNLKQRGKIIYDKSVDSGRDLIYLAKNFEITNSIVNKIVKLSKIPAQQTDNSFDFDAFIKKYEKDNNKILADMQINAIKMALTRKLSVLTGGPGTGKTMVLEVLISAIKEKEPEAKLTLVAPTGKAADRMSEVTNLPAKTIHRALGIKGFYNDELETINSDYLLIDESSMIDADLFNTLLSHVSDKTNILIVGDYHQLPSVGAGLVLRDLVQSHKVPMVELTNIFRQKGDNLLIDNAHAILNGLGIGETLGTTFNKQDDNSSSANFIEKNNTKDVRDTLINTIIQNAKEYGIGNVMVVTPMNSGDLGVDELNITLQNIFNKDENETYSLDNGNVFKTNDLVIQTVNNYKLGVNNGETGKIVSIYFGANRTSRKQWHIVVNFKSKGNVIYNPSNFKELKLGYAITIHKSQGSESPVVIMPIDKSQKKMLNKSLIYTAITRAKKKVTLIGQPDLFNEAIKLNNGINRISQIKEKIQSCM